MREEAVMGQGHSSESRCDCQGRRVIVGCDVLSESSFSALKGRRVSVHVVREIGQLVFSRSSSLSSFCNRGSQRESLLP